MIVYGGSGLLCNVWAETEEQKGYWRKKVIESNKYQQANDILPVFSA